MPVAGDESLHLPQERFARHLDILQANGSVIPLAEALRWGAAEAAGRRQLRIVITFDDAYAGALTAGVAELAARGLPATVFVAPGVLDEPLWWDELLSEAAEERRHHALTALGGNGPRIRAWADRQGWRRAPVPPYARVGSAAELDAAVSRGSVSLASHTWSHPALPRLSSDDLIAELDRPRVWLSERFGPAVLPLLAYPYGLADQRVAEAAAASGYEAAFRVSGGWLPETIADRFQLPRLNIPGAVSDDGFLLRISGLLSR